LFGNGSLSKERIVLAAYKKFGIEIADDPGCNKLEAALLCKYGELVEQGDVVFVASALRGQKRRKAA
jgi:hypothetical protein